MKLSFIARLFLIISFLIVLTQFAGCATLAPDGGRVKYDHASHPLVGPPFTAREDEDCFQAVTASAYWQRGNFYMEHGLGKKVEAGCHGFKGPSLTYTGAIGYTIPFRKR